MTTLEQFANKLEGCSKERVIHLIYDLTKSTKVWKDRFEQAEQDKKHLIIEKDKEMQKVQEQAEQEKKQLLIEKDKEMQKVQEQSK